MTSRFSALQNRDALPQRVPETTPVAHHAVVIPTSRKALPAKPDTAPAKNANKVLDARVRIHR
ncbi:CpaF family protein, partial [Mesorhizobium sp. M7A.F.Ca.CA.001.12.1.1]